MWLSKKALALVAVAGLALAGYAGAASAGLLPDGADMGLGANAKCARGLPDQAAEPAVENRLQLCERHHRKVGMPAFTQDGSSIDGKWVSFTEAPERGAILDYTSIGPFSEAVLFTSIEIGEGNYTSMIHGPAWMARGDGLVALVLNAPNAFLVVHNRADDARTVTFTVADGIDVALEDRNGTQVVVLTKDDHAAWIKIRGDGALSVDGQVVTATLEKGSTVGFAIKGYPRLLAHELGLLKRLANAAQDPDARAEWRERMMERRAADRPERPDRPERDDAPGLDEPAEDESLLEA
jgi:hypothetical protein